MGVRGMERFLEQWRMYAKDLLWRMILVPTSRERERWSTPPCRTRRGGLEPRCSSLTRPNFGRMLTPYRGTGQWDFTGPGGAPDAPPPPRPVLHLGLRLRRCVGTGVGMGCNHGRAFRSHWRRGLPLGGFAAGVDNPGDSDQGPGRRRGGRRPRCNPGRLPRNPVGGGFGAAEAAGRSGRCSPWAEFLAEEPVQPRGRNGKPKPSSLDLFEWSLGIEREKEPVGAGR